jgi:hypothetical protein
MLVQDRNAARLQRLFKVDGEPMRGYAVIGLMDHGAT